MWGGCWSARMVGADCIADGCVGRHRRGHRGSCGRCGERSPWYDRGGRDGWQRRWRHVDAGYVMVDLIGDTPRVNCARHGPTVAVVAWARHSSPFTRAFEDLVVHDAVFSNKNAAAARYGVTWRAVNSACIRLAEEALGRVDLLEGLVAVAIDEVKYKKGQRYLTIVCDHFTGQVVWASEGRSKATVGAFFDALGPDRARAVRFVSADGAEWIRGGSPNEPRARPRPRDGHLADFMFVESGRPRHGTHSTRSSRRRHSHEAHRRRRQTASCRRAPTAPYLGDGTRKRGHVPPSPHDAPGTSQPGEDFEFVDVVRWRGHDPASPAGSMRGELVARQLCDQSP